MTLRQELDLMHDGYVDAVNTAVEDGDLVRVHELADAYDEEATTLVAVREGRTDLLPLRRPIHKGASNRRWAGWLRRAS